MIYAYIRVSTELQNYGSQRFEIQNYCSANGLSVDHWVKESISGTVKVEKRTLGKIIKKMHPGDRLICTELSRLGRNMLMVMSILNTCSAKGIYIHSIKDNFDLSDNINSKIIAFAFALAAEIERNLISQRTKEALALKKASGIRLGRPPGKSKKKENTSFVFFLFLFIFFHLLLGEWIYILLNHYNLYKHSLFLELNYKIIYYH